MRIKIKDCISKTYLAKRNSPIDTSLLNILVDNILSAIQQELIKELEGMKKPLPLLDTIKDFEGQNLYAKDYGYNLGLSDMQSKIEEICE